MGLLRARPFPRKQPVSLQTGRDRARPLQDTFPNIKSADRTLPAAGRDGSSKQCAGIYRRSLVGGLRPQAPVRTDATAPVLLSRLRRLRVGTNSTPLRPPDGGHPLHFVVPPFPTQPASLGLRGGPIMQGEKKSSPRLLLAATIFLFLRHAQNPIHVVFGSEQFYHFFSCLLVLWIPLFVLCLQHGILELST